MSEEAMTGVSFETWARLLARVRAATAPDPDIDRDLWRLLFFDPELAKPGYGWMKTPGIGHKAPPWTGSTDAALSLVEHFIPRSDLAIYTGWALQRYGTEIKPGQWSIPGDAPRGCWVRYFGEPQFARNATCEAATVPLAIIGTLIEALAAKDTPYPHHTMNIRAWAGAFNYPLRSESGHLDADAQP